MAERRTLGVADQTRVPAWTREEIEAWVNAYPGESRVTLARRTLVRLCPEAPDYRDLRNKLMRLRVTRVRGDWHWTATEDEIVAHIENAVAALWSRSLSEPFDGEAHDEANDARGGASAPREGTDEGPR